MDPFLLLIKVRFLEFSPNLLFLQEDTSWDIILHLITMSISFNKKNPVSVYSCAYFYVRGVDVCVHACIPACVRVCMHTCTFVCTRVHTCVHVHMCVLAYGPEDDLECCFFGTESPCILRQGLSLAWNSQSRLGCLASELKDLLSLCPRHWHHSLPGSCLAFNKGSGE